MNHPFGPCGPYFVAPCPRDRFPSVLNEMDKIGDKFVAHLGVPNILDMGARLKRGRLPDADAEQRAAEAAKAAQLEQAEYSIRLDKEDWHRAVDIYYPRSVRKDAHADASDAQQISSDDTRLCSSRNQCKASKKDMKGKSRKKKLPNRQVGEPPYTGKCKHCRLEDSDDVKCDEYGRNLARKSRVLAHLKYFNEIMYMNRNADQSMQRNHA